MGGCFNAQPLRVELDLDPDEVARNNIFSHFIPLTADVSYLETSSDSSSEHQLEYQIDSKNLNDSFTFVDSNLEQEGIETSDDVEARPEYEQYEEFSTEPSCVPTGPEDCFNGIDDDCDGEVDEGSPEVCDDQDNDCDGYVDEGFEDKGQTCSVTQQFCTAPGTMKCNYSGSATYCQFNAPCYPMPNPTNCTCNYP